MADAWPLSVASSARSDSSEPELDSSKPSTAPPLLCCAAPATSPASGAPGPRALASDPPSATSSASVADAWPLSVPSSARHSVKPTSATLLSPVGSSEGERGAACAKARTRASAASARVPSAWLPSRAPASTSALDSAYNQSPAPSASGSLPSSVDASSSACSRSLPSAAASCMAQRRDR